MLLSQEARIGERVALLPSVRDEHYEAWRGDDPLMARVVGTVGVVKAVQRHKKLVLVQFYVDEEGALAEYWVPIDCLKQHRGDSAGGDAKAEALRSAEDAAARLGETESALSKLMARRAIFSLCAQPQPQALAFLSSQARQHRRLRLAAAGTPNVSDDALEGADEEEAWNVAFRFVFLALSEGIELADLSVLGECKRGPGGSAAPQAPAPLQQSPVQQLERNLAAFLSLHTTRRSGAELRQALLSRIEELLRTSARFITEYVPCCRSWFCCCMTCDRL